MSEPATSSSNNKQTPGVQKGIRWEEVATTAGITAAHILVGRLQSEGIPARAWQEGAGQATGLVVGLLGTAHVVVPEEYADTAREILEDVDYFIDEDFLDEENEE